MTCTKDILGPLAIRSRYMAQAVLQTVLYDADTLLHLITTLLVYGIVKMSWYTKWNYLEIRKDYLLSLCLTSDIVVPPSSNCLCEDLRSACDREHTKVLELEAEISKQKQLFIESEKRFAFLEQNYVSLQLKFQNYKQCIDTSSASNAIFEINKLRKQLQGKDDTIRNLETQINITRMLNVGSTEGSCDQQALETDRIQLKDTITSLRIQLDGLKVENVSLKRRYDELSKANTHSRTAYTEKLRAFTAENTKLKAQVTGKTSSGPSTSETPKVLAPGIYNLGSKYIPPPKRANWVKPTPLPKKKQVTFQEPPRTSNRPTQKPPVQQNKKPNVSVNLSTRTKPATESRKPMPKSHTRNHRILPSKSVNARRAADHNRKLNVVDHNQFVICSLKSVNTKTPQAKHSVNHTKKVVGSVKPQWKPTGRHFALFNNCPLTRIMEPIVEPLELTPSVSSSSKVTMISRFPDCKLSDRKAGSKGISVILWNAEERDVVPPGCSIHTVIIDPHGIRGANQHMTYTDKELDNVLDISHLKIKVGHANGTKAFISKIRNPKLSNGLVLYDVLVIPEYCVTLISIHKLAKENKVIIAFDESRCYFLNQDLNLKNVMGTGSQCERLDHPTEPSANSSSSVSGEDANTADFPVNSGNDADSKIDALLRNGTWEIIELPKDRKAIGSKWIYKIKYRSSSEIDRYKARRVAQGFGQKEGIDYAETFSPVVKMVTVRCLLNIVVSKSWPVFQLDVNNAFLYGDLVEIVYMRPPEGYFPSENGFGQSKSDYSLYTKSDKGVFLALLIYVDDIIITGNNISEIEKFKVYLKSKFMIKDLGKLKYFLGIEVIDTDKDICLNQRKYVLDLLSEYGMLACKPAKTPLMSKLIISNEASKKEPVLDNITDYQKLMGKLIYLTNTHGSKRRAMTLLRPRKGLRRDLHATQ
ncbi:ribonuclease H-like domain-containing protein [Tanacetum coccineum]